MLAARHDDDALTLEVFHRGLFKILKGHPKIFTLRIKNATLNIAVDRLKPAFLDATWLNILQ